MQPTTVMVLMRFIPNISQILHITALWSVWKWLQRTSTTVLAWGTTLWPRASEAYSAEALTTSAQRKGAPLRGLRHSIKSMFASHPGEVVPDGTQTQPEFRHWGIRINWAKRWRATRGVAHRRGQPRLAARAGGLSRRTSSRNSRGDLKKM